jgi:hypothetical protein
MKVKEVLSYADKVAIKEYMFAHNSRADYQIISNRIGKSSFLIREYVAGLQHTVGLGRKDTPYAETEEEMLQGYVAPTYRELSPTEKLIYKSIKVEPTIKNYEPDKHY